MTNGTPPAGARVWAFLIGIDEYLALNDLRGCVHDVEAFRVFLVNQLEVPEAQIKTLTNGAATRAAILDAFQTFLIDNPDIQNGDQILFHYSGHGSRMWSNALSEPDGRDETIVPHDSRTNKVFDIPDKTMAVLLERLAAAKGDNITVVLDCCHSGSGTRKVGGPGTALTRRVEDDGRRPPPELDDALRTGAAVRSAGPSGWALEGLPYVLLAGCKDDQESNEYWAADAGDDGVWHGALTYHLLCGLGAMAPGTTYAELHAQAAARVNALYPGQLPQCEGDRTRVVFGDARVARDPFIPVTSVSDGSVTLGAGLVHGLRRETELALYAPTVRTRAELAGIAPVAHAKVMSTTATTARAKLLDAAADVPVLARAIVTRSVNVGDRLTVALHAEDGSANAAAIEDLRQAMGTAAAGGQPSPYLRVAGVPGRGFDVRVVAEDGRLIVYDAHGEMLVVPEDIAPGGRTGAQAVVHALEAIARFRIVTALSNTDAHSGLAGGIKIRLGRWVTGDGEARFEDLAAEAVDAGGEMCLTYDAYDDADNLYVVEIENASDTPFYPHVFVLNPDYSIVRLYPDVGQQELLRPGTKLLPNPGGRGGALLRVSLPERPRWDASRDIIKVIATTEPARLGLLAQDGLNVPPRRTGSGQRGDASDLERLVDTLVNDAGTRFGGSGGAQVGEDWAAAALPYTVVRADRSHRLVEPAGTVELGDGLTLEKPAGFVGEITVTTLGQSKRGADGQSDLRPPPGLADRSDRFAPLGRSGTRSVGPSSVVLSLDVPEAARSAITADNPLRLRLPTLPGEEVLDALPVVFDGQDYLIVGHGTDDGAAVEIVDLPPLIEPTKRGIGRTVRLFVYRKLGRRLPQLGLRRARMEANHVVYEDASPDQFAAGDTVAVLVHGFASDTAWMVDGPARFLAQGGRPYDHVLTFDYESVGTGVATNGAALAGQLRVRCGLRADDGITVHVFAHSMGCLVSRCCVELSGGDELVDRVVLAGPPNEGTALANLSRGGLFLVTALLNHRTLVPPAGAVGWTLEQLYGNSPGWSDLVVGSEVTRALNDGTGHDGVPYLVLAGENLADGSAGRRLDRLARKVLDTGLDAIFNDQNDAVIGLASMRTVRHGAYPGLRTETLPCDHFQYYANAEARHLIREWLTA